MEAERYLSEVLADYLDGDVYFHITREKHNLDRCRTQFKLVSDMEAQWDALNKIVGIAGRELNETTGQ